MIAQTEVDSAEREELLPSVVCTDFGEQHHKLILNDFFSSFHWLLHAPPQTSRLLECNLQQLLPRRAISSCAVLPIFHSPLDLPKSIPNPMQNLHTHLPTNQPPTTIPSAPPPLNLSFRTDSHVIVEAGVFAHNSPAPKIIMITSRHNKQFPFPHPSIPFPPSTLRTSTPPRSH